MDTTKDPRAFLVGVMNDRNVDGPLRIKAAAALLEADNAAQREREGRAFQRFVDAGKAGKVDAEWLQSQVQKFVDSHLTRRAAPMRKCLSCGARESLDGTAPCGH